MEAGKKQEEKNELVQSFLFVRQAVGLIGISLPILLLLYSFFSGTGIRPSISDYYHTPMGDVLVGSLCAIGVFLLSYKGYKKKSDEWLSDKWLARVAGVSVIAVAVFPMRNPQTTDAILPASGFTGHPPILHYGSAVVFFFCLALFCLFVFTRGDRTEAGKIIWTKRNKIFVACGVLIVGSIIALTPYMLMSEPNALTQYHYLFFGESVGVLAFSASWLTKGRALSEFKSMITELRSRINR